MSDTITTADVERRLSRLATTAPPRLADRVLVATGVADQVATVDGPIGPLRIVFGPHGVSACIPAAHWRDHLAHEQRRPVVEADALPPRLASHVERALTTGKLGRLPIDLEALSEFQRAVLRKTAEIPPGEVRPYGWVAREIGKPGAVRAVGSALNKNPVPVLIPCHRVSRSDGHLGQYAYGREMKRDLLAAEGLDPDAIETLADRRIRYIGSDTTGIYCHPTCRAARRITDRHRIEFRSETAAAAAGYRPCKVCRPAA
jgi:O-6-methylguanine DNA methyltransferase